MARTKIRGLFYFHASVFEFSTDVARFTRFTRGSSSVRCNENKFLLSGIAPRRSGITFLMNSCQELITNNAILSTLLYFEVASLVNEEGKIEVKIIDALSGLRYRLNAAARMKHRVIPIFWTFQLVSFKDISRYYGNLCQFCTRYHQTPFSTQC